MPDDDPDATNSAAMNHLFKHCKDRFGQHNPQHGKEFHYSCIKKWIESGPDRLKCPLCQARLAYISDARLAHAYKDVAAWLTSQHPMIDDAVQEFLNNASVNMNDATIQKGWPIFRMAVRDLLLQDKSIDPTSRDMADVMANALQLCQNGLDNSTKDALHDQEMKRLRDRLTEERVPLFMEKHVIPRKRLRRRREREERQQRIRKKIIKFILICATYPFRANVRQYVIKPIATHVLDTPPECLENVLDFPLGSERATLMDLMLQELNFVGQYYKKFQIYQCVWKHDKSVWAIGAGMYDAHQLFLTLKNNLN